MDNSFRKIPGLKRYWVNKEGVVIREGFYSYGKYSNPLINKRYFKEREVKCSLTCGSGCVYKFFIARPENKYFSVHRAVASAFPEICGEWFEGAVVDHINCNTLDNRAENLRVCTQRDNCNNPLTLQHKRRDGISKTKEYFQNYYQAHKEKFREYTKKWRSEHKERTKQLRREWYYKTKSK